MSRRKTKKKNNRKYTKDPLDTSKPLMGESEVKFDNLPRKIKEPPKISPLVQTFSTQTPMLCLLNLLTTMLMKIDHCYEYQGSSLCYLRF